MKNNGEMNTNKKVELASTTNVETITHVHLQKGAFKGHNK